MPKFPIFNELNNYISSASTLLLKTNENNDLCNVIFIRF